jgi:hypothetical protein
VNSLTRYSSSKHQHHHFLRLQFAGKCGFGVRGRDLLDLLSPGVGVVFSGLKLDLA